MDPLCCNRGGDGWDRYGCGIGGEGGGGRGGALARLPAHACNARLLARNLVSIWGLFHLHHPPTNCTRLFSYDIANLRQLAPSLSSFSSDGTESSC